MQKQHKSNCCNGCRNGQPGGNDSCQAKRLLEKMQKMKLEKELVTKK